MEATKDSLIFELIKDENYQIKENGEIFKRVRKWDKKIKNPLFKKVGYIDDKGYGRILYKGKNLRVHRIIWAKFKGYLRKGLVINHIDGRKNNNALANLELVSASENVLHGFTRLHRKVAAAKLSWTDVAEIRELWGQKKYTQKKLCEVYGVSKSRMSDICNEVTYRNEVNHHE